MQQTRIVIADPADLARQGLRGLLSTQEDLEVVASCRAVDEVVSESIVQSPDVALLGYGFSEPQRLEAVRHIVKNRPWIPVLVLTDHPELDAFLSCVRAGARGYLGGNVDASGLIEAVRKLSSGGCAMEPSILCGAFCLPFAGPRGNATHLMRDGQSLTPDQAHASREGGATSDGTGPGEQRDRRAAGDKRGHSQDAPEAHL